MYSGIYGSFKFQKSIEYRESILSSITVKLTGNISCVAYCFSDTSKFGSKSRLISTRQQLYDNNFVKAMTFVI